GVSASPPTRPSTRSSGPTSTTSSAARSRPKIATDVPDIPEHLTAAYQHLIGLPEAPPPGPWRKVPTRLVGGLTDVGFLDSSDAWIVVPQDGRGVFDCATGERLARDPSHDFEYDRANLLVRGIGPLAGHLIRTAGLHGGGLALQTADGWSLERLT